MSAPQLGTGGSILSVSRNLSTRICCKLYRPIAPGVLVVFQMAKICRGENGSHRTQRVHEQIQRGIDGDIRDD